MKHIWLRLFFLICFPICLLGQGSLMLVGGGTEDYNDWSDEPYGWFVQQAGQGKIINIDVDGASPWYPDYFIWLGADASSHAMQIATLGAANDPAVFQELVSADGIFVEGGDQWDYVNTWRGTLVEDALHQVFNNGGVIGGTSAGLAILGEVVFDASNGSAFPEVVAYNPYHASVQFTDDFLEMLPGVLTDSHFHPRGRLGRLVPMLARRMQDFGDPDLMGIGVDDNTALCVPADRISTAYGEGTVTILFKSENSQIVAAPNQAPTFTHLNYFQLNHGAVFDLNSRILTDPGPNLQAVFGPPSPPLYSAVNLNGSQEGTSRQGEVVIRNLTGEPLNAWNGDLVSRPGLGNVPHAVVMPKIWDHFDFFENRWVGGMFGVASNPHYAAIYLDNNTTSSISDEGVLTADQAAYVLDTHGMTHAGFVQFKDTNYPGIIDARLHFLGDGDTYDLLNHGGAPGPGPGPDVSVSISATNPPLVIPPSGGSAGYTMQFTNNTTEPQSRDVWTTLIKPGGETSVVFGPST